MAAVPVDQLPTARGAVVNVDAELFALEHPVLTVR